VLQVGIANARGLSSADVVDTLKKLKNNHNGKIV